MGEPRNPTAREQHDRGLRGEEARQHWHRTLGLFGSKIANHDDECAAGNDILHANDRKGCDKSMRVRPSQIMPAVTSGPTTVCKLNILRGPRSDGGVMRSVRATGKER